MARPSNEVCALLMVLFMRSLSLVFSHGHAEPVEAPRLLVISFSGFRHDYLHIFNLTNLRSFYEKGVRAEWLQPYFITDCAINHYTLVTGLYPESHGAALGDAYDSATGQYLCGPKDDQKHGNKYAGEPIWMTNNMRKSGSIQWPYTTAAVKPEVSEGVTKLVDSGLPRSAALRQKFDVLLKWMEDEDNHEDEENMEHTHGAAEHHHRSADATPEPLNLALLYHGEPDVTGHTSGWNSTEMKATLEAIDKDFGDFVSKLASRKLLERTNIIVLSDHGMADVVGEPIYLSDCLKNISAYDVMATGPIVSLWPKAGSVDTATLATFQRDISSTDSCKRLAVYDAASMPASYRYRPSPATNGIAPLILESPPGVPVYMDRAASSAGAAKGMHGWNNSWDAMKGIFVARGPAFKQGYLKKGFESVHVYPLMCKLLGLTPAPNNGTLSAVADILSSGALAGADDHTTIFTELLVIVGAAAIAGTFIVGACRLQRAIVRHVGGRGSKRLVGVPGVSPSNDSRRLLASDHNKLPLLGSGGAANDSSDEESL